MRKILILAVSFLICSCNRYLLSETELEAKIEYSSVVEGLDRPREVYNLDLYMPDSLPKEILKFERLNELDISKPGFSSLPSFIGQFKNLQTLIILNGDINTLPPEIGKLKNLKWLRLWNLKLTKLPSQIAKLKKLEKLELFSNDLRELPIGVAKLLNLKEIGIDANSQLDYYDALNKLSKLPKLNRLNLNYYPHDTLPSNIGSLKNLESITLWSNESGKLNLDNFIKKILVLKKLRVIDLSGTPVNASLKEVYIERIKREHENCNVIWNTI